MPCVDDRGYNYSYSADEFVITQKRLDQATRVACEAFKAIDIAIKVHDLSEVYEDFGISTESIDWWFNHQAEDKKRIEDLRKGALAKLTAEEREALGI